jgi:heptosyltransferase I
VIRTAWAPLLEENPFVDQVIPFERTFSGIAATRRQLREQRFDLAIDFQGLLQSALVAAAARPDRLVGFHRSQVREKAAALFYSTCVEAHSQHVVDRNLELVAAAGASSLLHTFSLPEGSPEGRLPKENSFSPVPSPAGDRSSGRSSSMRNSPPALMSLWS